MSVAAAPPVWSLPGSLDPTFPPGPGPNGPVRAAQELPDGSLLVGGDFDHYDGQAALRLVRISADGNPDPAFHADLGTAADVPSVTSLLVAPDGAVYATVPGFIPQVFRVRTDGSKDPAYGTQSLPLYSFLLSDASIVGLSPGVQSSLLNRWTAGGENLAAFAHRLVTTFSGRPREGSLGLARLDAQGRLLLEDGFTSIDDVPTSFARLNVDGSLDTTFAPDLVGSAFWLLPDGRFLHLHPTGTPAGGVRVGRSTAEFKTDPTFTANPVFDAPGVTNPPAFVVRDVAWETGGKLLLAGPFTTVNGQPRSHVARLYPDGTLDDTFDAGAGFAYGPGVGSSNSILQRVLVRSNGSILVAGEFRQVQGVARPYLALLQGGERIGPPHWLTQPADQTNYALATAEFSVSADGVEPITFQWQRNATNLPQQTNAVLRLPQLQPSDAGDYRAIATNPHGSVTSVVARLVVVPASPPSITAATSLVQASPGTSPVLSAIATGTPPPAIQWFLGTNAVPGATQAVWTVTNVRAAQAGTYHAEAVNPLGLARSADVTLEVSAEGRFPGQVDVSFFADAGGIEALALDSANRILVGGTFTRLGGQPRRGVARLFPDGSLDPSFDPGAGPQGGKELCCPIAESVWPASVRAIVALPDHRVLVGGNFTSFNGRLAGGIVRLNADGSVDTSFAPGNGVQGGVGPVVLALATSSDGSVLAGGFFGSPTAGIVRWLADGTVDPSFQVGTGATEGNTFQKPGVGVPLPLDGTHVRVILLHTSIPRISVGGDFRKFNGQPRTNLVRLTSLGEVDPTFNAPSPTPGVVRALAHAIGGRLMVAWEAVSVSDPHLPGLGRVMRLDESGGVDDAFATVVTDSRITALAVEPTGHVILVGPFTKVNNVSRRGIARLNPTGALDAGFSLPEEGNPGFGSANQSLLRQPDGKILVAGGFGGFAGIPRPGLARLHAGALPETPPTLIHEPTNQVVLEGATAEFAVLALSGATHSYQWFHEGRPIPDATQASLTLPNLAATQAGHYSVVVSNRYGSVASRSALLTVEAAPAQPGNVDLRFFSERPALVNDGAVVTALSVQDDGRLLVAGVFTNRPVTTIDLERWNPDGTVSAEDSSKFPQAIGASPTTILIQPQDGRILVAPSGIGSTSVNGFAISRFLPDGSLDTTFKTRIAPVGTEIRTAALEAGGTLLVGGSFITINGFIQRHLGRLAADGSRLPGFSPVIADGTDALYPPISTLLVQPDGRIIVAGNFQTVNGEPRNRVARLLADGRTDPTFLTREAPDAPVATLALDPHGRILVAYFNAPVASDGQPQSLVRWLPDGTPDATFQPPPFHTFGFSGGIAIRAIGFDPLDHVLIGGDFETGDATRPFRNIARLLADGALDVAWNVSPGANQTVGALRVNPDASVYIAGSFTEVQGIQRRGIARLVGETPFTPPRLEAPTLANGQLHFSFSTRSGHTYFMETAETIGGAWQRNRIGLVGDGSRRTLWIPAPSADTARFVRLRVD